MINLKTISKQIRKVLDNKRNELELTFSEGDHTYTMRDVNGVLRNDFLSVSKVVKKFYKQFDADGKSLQMCKGDEVEAAKLRENWKRAGDLSTNMGSRVHYELEKELISHYKNYKEIRQPIFEVNEEQTRKSDGMIIGGKSYLELMKERGAVLLDTEIIMGSPELGFTGQPDKVWLMMNKNNDDFGFVITDWKTNQKKNFEVQPYTGKMYKPFSEYHDTALTHYFVQLPLYGKLLLKMLEGSKFENVKLLGCVVVLLKEDGTFEEYKVPPLFNNTILKMDISNYIVR